MTSFFWDQLEACWERPFIRPKIHEIVASLQTLAKEFTPQQSEQIESPPPYSTPKSVYKAAHSYGASVPIPAQQPVQVNLSFANAANLLPGRSTPILKRITAIGEKTGSRDPLLPPASQANQSDKKKKSSTPIASLPTKHQKYSGSGSTATTRQIPLSKPSSPQLRSAWPYQNPTASESNVQQPGKFPMCRYYATEFTENR